MYIYVVYATQPGQAWPVLSTARSQMFAFKNHTQFEGIEQCDEQNKKAKEKKEKKKDKRTHIDVVYILSPCHLARRRDATRMSIYSRCEILNNIFTSIV